MILILNYVQLSYRNILEEDLDTVHDSVSDLSSLDNDNDLEKLQPEAVIGTGGPPPEYAGEVKR